MKETIYREDAIELLERQKEKDSKGYAGNFCRTIVDRCIKAIENMPSAERTEVIYCKDCKYWDRQHSTTFWMPCISNQTPSEFSCIHAEKK